jgi:hypothetical protein
MNRVSAGVLIVALVAGLALLAWAFAGRRGSQHLLKQQTPSTSTPRPERLTVTWFPGLTQPGTAPQEPVSRSTNDPTLIGAMRNHLMSLPPWPVCNGGPCISSCPADFGVDYRVAITKGGVAELSADLDPNGCSSARITLRGRGWSMTWPAARTLSRRAPLNAPVWADIAEVLDLPLCNASLPHPPGGPLTCVGW